MKNGHAWSRRLFAGLGGLVLTLGVLFTAQAGAQASSHPRPAATAAQQYCYHNGTFACLNAWSGGPAVNTYTGGIDRNDTNQNFNLIDNSAGGKDIQFTGAGPNHNKCIGDLGNDPNVARAGLVPCFSGWGTNFHIQQNCSDHTLLTFVNAHWGGSLGPVANWTNGSPFYLNKPELGKWCFSQTTLG